MKLFLILWIGFFHVFAMGSERLPATSLVEHPFHKGETLWFLAQVYYGDGDLYKKIAEFNHLADSDELKEGLTLYIPETSWKFNSPEFKNHYQQLWDRHEKKISANERRHAQPVTTSPTPNPELEVKKANGVVGAYEQTSDILPSDKTLQTSENPPPNRSATEGAQSH